MEFKSLAWLIGEPLKFVVGDYEQFPPDGEVKIIDEFDKSVLLDMEYIECHGWMQREPRHIRILVSKSSLICGDWVLQRMNGQRVMAEKVVTG